MSAPEPPTKATAVANAAKLIAETMQKLDDGLVELQWEVSQDEALRVAQRSTYTRLLARALVDVAKGASVAGKIQDSVNELVIGLGVAKEQMTTEDIEDEEEPSDV